VLRIERGLKRCRLDYKPVDLAGQIGRGGGLDLTFGPLEIIGGEREGRRAIRKYGFAAAKLSASSSAKRCSRVEGAFSMTAPPSILALICLNNYVLTCPSRPSR
jgi:hypothetical protein